MAEICHHSFDRKKAGFIKFVCTQQQKYGESNITFHNMRTHRVRAMKKKRKIRKREREMEEKVDIYQNTTNGNTRITGCDILHIIAH
jgi:hypothetical protein